MTMENKNLEQFGSPRLPEDIVAVRYDLEQHGDTMLSAQLVKAASEGDWPEVTRLLAAGADPRICRYSDTYQAYLSHYQSAH